MRRRFILVAAMVLVIGLLNRVAPAQDKCGAGSDLVVQALERLKADSSGAQLENANQLLKRAAELCSELGDAWYYRSLVERKIGRVPQADFAQRQAQRFPSEAMQEQRNPFVLAAPLPRATPNGKGTDAVPAGPINEKWALIIGIGAFNDKTIEPLRYTASDARSFDGVLLDPRFGRFRAQNVHMLLDGDATTRRIKEELNWLARKAQPDDLVVVYVATHGSSRDLDTVGVNYIITHDTDLGAQQNPDSLYATALPMVEISNAIANRVKARRTAIFIDTCYSGNAAATGKRLIAPGIASASISAETLDQIRQGVGRIIVAASGTEEESFESEALKHGFFTYYLVEALQQKDGRLPLSEVFAYTREHVSQRVASEYRQYHLQQNPVMSRSEDATDFALSAPSSATVAGAGPAGQVNRLRVGR